MYNLRAPLAKPHIYLLRSRRGFWRCSDGRWEGHGFTPAQAYDGWQRMGEVMRGVMRARIDYSGEHWGRD